jgi:hypothetical protein
MKNEKSWVRTATYVCCIMLVTMLFTSASLCPKPKPKEPPPTELTFVPSIQQCVPKWN